MQAPAAPRSPFIDGLAWTTLIVSVFAIPLSLLLLMASSAQNVDAREVLSQRGLDVVLPDSVLFIFKHLKTISWVILLLSVFSVLSSLALLKRRNWARIAFVAMLALDIVANMVGVIYALFAPSASVSAAQMQAEWMIRLATGLNAILVVGLSIAMAWMVKRLMSGPIRREFGVQC
jgi:hypothetical protein